MLETLLTVLVVVAMAVLVYATTKPSSFRIERQRLVEAPPEKIFPLINDFRNWTQWSPFEALDAGLKRTYSGAPSGVGAIYEYSGNARAGEGRMQITESSPPHKIVSRLDFVRPLRAHNVVEFILTPVDEGTVVSWAMHGDATYTGKLMSMFVSTERLVGKQFEQGLNTLKTVAERS